MIWISNVFHTLGLLPKDLFWKVAIEERIMNIELENSPFALKNMAENRAYRSWLHNRAKSLMKIDTRSLMKAFSN